MGHDALLFLAVFAACAVEAVEAVTVVLAMGTARDGRSAAAGTIAALLALAVIVALLGPALARMPLDDLRLVVGGLLLIFGLQWLRKAILRAGGRKALHDEDAIYAREVAQARAAAPDRHRGLDAYAVTVSFKAVLLEGLEVAFIVVTLGSNGGDVRLAAAAALLALVLVAGAGAALRAPLSRVPENTLKFAVGAMLTAFGMFWAAEGAGANWPGGDAALPVLVLATVVLGLGLAGVLRRTAPDVAAET